MNDRKRLIELIEHLDTYNNPDCERCMKYGSGGCYDRCFAEKTADYLIAHGVTVERPKKRVRVYEVH